MRLAKSIDELYEEVRDYDLVMCNDAPLALALNNRLDKPMIGRFAVTPRQLAGELAMDILKKPTMDDIRTVRAVTEMTGYKLRYVHGEIENFRKMRRYTGDVRKYLRGKRTKNVFEYYMKVPTLERAMEAFNGQENTYFNGMKVAVIGDELYDELDKNMNPKFGTYEIINPFKRGRFSVPEFRELSNDRQMAENAADMITKENAGDIAIVLDVESPIADAVRSALYRKKIPFINDLSVRDLSNVRDFLEFLMRARDFGTLKVKQIRELISAYGGFIHGRYDEYLVEKYIDIAETERTAELLRIMRDITGMTYLQVCDAVAGKEGPQIKILLSEMDIAGRLVNTDDTDDMLYAVNNFSGLKHNEQIPPNEKEGVLLVDCKNSVYIDRPVVLYLGLGTEWDKDLSDLDLVDYRMKDDVIERDTMKFQILLQQGTSRVYMCTSVKNGKTSKPCSMFERAESGDSTFECFGDIAPCVAGPWYRPPEEHIPVIGTEEISRDRVQVPFSKSSYNNFVTCPRMYMFGKLLGDPDKGDTVLGSLLHEYAEFRICHPEIVAEKGTEHYVQMISEACIGLFTPDVRDLILSKISTSVADIDRFIEINGFSDRVQTGRPRSNKKENRFFADAGLPLESSQMTELTIVSRGTEMEGILDVLDGSRIYDFKTGKKKTVSDIIKGMEWDSTKIMDYPREFQPLFYLSLIEEMNLGDETFTLFYTSANGEKAALGTETDIENNMVSISLVRDPKRVLDEIFEGHLVFHGDKTKAYCFLQPRKEELLDAVAELLSGGRQLVCEESKSYVAERLGISKSGEIKHIESALKKFARVEEGIFAVNGGIAVTLDALSRFRETVKAAYEENSEMYYTGHPARPLMKCANCYFRDVCIVSNEGKEVVTDE